MIKYITIIYLLFFIIGCTNHAALMQQHQANEMQRLKLLSQVKAPKAFELKAADPTKPIVLDNVGEFVIYGPSPIRGDDFRMTPYQAPPNEALQLAGMIFPPLMMFATGWVNSHYNYKQWQTVFENGIGSNYNFSNDGGGHFNFTGGTGDRTGSNWTSHDQLHPFVVTPYKYEASTGSVIDTWITQP